MINIFGYLKPYNDEMKYKDIKRYRDHYCTVCHGLRKTMGFLYSSIINYEFVLLYIFLNSLTNYTDTNVQFRCQVIPLRKIKTSYNKELLEYVSFLNYYMVIMKLKDDYNDDKKKIFKILSKIMVRNKKYVLFCNKYSNLISKLDNEFEKLNSYEFNKVYDFDKLSNTMGEVIYEIVLFYLQDKNITEFHKALSFARDLGKWIYLIDAYDDLEDDRKNGKFNPLNTFIYDSIDRSKVSGEIMLKMIWINIKQSLDILKSDNIDPIIINIVEFGMLQETKKIHNKYLKEEG